MCTGVLGLFRLGSRAPTDQGEHVLVPEDRVRTTTRITAENWRWADPNSARAFEDSPSGPIRRGADDWAARFLAPSLSESVPNEVTDLFEVAKSTCTYGWMYFPLYVQGHDQAQRAAELALSIRWRSVAGKAKKPNYYTMIKQLLEDGVIDAGQAEMWQQFRELRNWGAHPSAPSGLPPATVARFLDSICDAINELFADPVPGPPA